MITIENAYIQEYGNLRVTSLTQELHERTCAYWFTVTTGAMAHTAFRTRAELNTWLSDRGLQLGEGRKWGGNGQYVPAQLADAGEWSTVEIIGEYRKVSHRDREQFDSVQPLLTTEVMDNGRYTAAKITEDESVRSVHYMNVNYR